MVTVPPISSYRRPDSSSSLLRAVSACIVPLSAGAWMRSKEVAATDTGTPACLENSINAVSSGCLLIWNEAVWPSFESLAEHGVVPHNGNIETSIGKTKDNRRDRTVGRCVPPDIWSPLSHSFLFKPTPAFRRVSPVENSVCQSVVGMPSSYP